jgi:nitrite reductase/ring-hydroxylating ferredoxin subunit
LVVQRTAKGFGMFSKSMSLFGLGIMYKTKAAILEASEELICIGNIDML